MSKVYRGWVQPRGEDDYDMLRDMGVFGPMLYRDEHITECYCDFETLQEIKKKYHFPFQQSFEKINEDELSKIRSSYFDRPATNGDPDYNGSKFWDYRGSRCKYVIKCYDDENFVTALYIDDLPKIGDALFLHGPTCQLHREKKWSMILTLLRGGLVSVYKIIEVKRDTEVKWENEYNANIELKFRARLDE